MKNKFLFYTQQSVVILFSFLQPVDIFLNKKDILKDKTQDKDQYTSYFMSTLVISSMMSCWEEKKVILIQKMEVQGNTRFVTMVLAWVLQDTVADGLVHHNSLPKLDTNNKCPRIILKENKNTFKLFWSG